MTNAVRCVALSVTVCLVGCERFDRRDYEIAAAKNTVDSYREYLKKRPDGRYAPEVRDRVEEILFQTAKAKDTPEAFRSFLKDVPASLHRDEAERRAAYLERMDLIEKAFGSNDFDDRMKALSEVRRLPSDDRLLRYVPYLISMLGDETGIKEIGNGYVRIETVATIALETLERIAGRNLGKNQKAWKNWLAGRNG